MNRLLYRIVVLLFAAADGARDGRWKLLTRNFEPVELFDLEADPQERNNLPPDYPAVAARLGAAIRTFLAEPRLSPQRQGRLVATDIRVRRRLGR